MNDNSFPGLAFNSFQASICFFFIFLKELYLIICSQFDDVWVTKQFEILDLPSNFANNIKALYFLTIQNFYSNFMTGQLMGGD